MLKIKSIIFLFFIFISNYYNISKASNTLNENTEKNNHLKNLYQTEAINEIKKQLYDIYNYVLINKYVANIEFISLKDLDEIIETILSREDIMENFIPFVSFQLELKAQNKENNEKALLNANFDYATAIGFYIGIITKIITINNTNNENSGLKKTVDTINTTILLISSFGQLITLIIKNKLSKKKDIIGKTNNLLQEKRIELNNILVNLLINALEEKVKSYI